MSILYFVMPIIMGLNPPMTMHEFQAMCYTKPNAVIDSVIMTVRFPGSEKDHPGFLFRCGVPRVKPEEKVDPVIPPKKMSA